VWKRTASGRLKFGGDRNRIFGAFKIFELVGGGVVRDVSSAVVTFTHVNFLFLIRESCFSLSLKRESVYILHCI
jgi:hypothetical protein